MKALDRFFKAHTVNEITYTCDGNYIKYNVTLLGGGDSIGSLTIDWATVKADNLTNPFEVAYNMIVNDVIRFQV